eukprot:472020_1
MALAILDALDEVITELDYISTLIPTHDSILDASDAIPDRPLDDEYDPLLDTTHTTDILHHDLYETQCWICDKCKTINNLTLTMWKYNMRCCVPACSSAYLSRFHTIPMSSRAWNVCPHDVFLEYKPCRMCVSCCVDEKEKQKAPPVLKDINLNSTSEEHKRSLLFIHGYIRYDIGVDPTRVFKIIALYCGLSTFISIGRT